MPAAFDPILVPFDGSEYSKFAAAHARLIAEKSGAKTVLAFALPPGAFEWDLTSAAYQAAVQEASAFLVEEARKFHTPVETHLLDGVPPDALVEEADRMGAGLIVMGTRGRTAASGILLGSTARHVLHASTRPVMVVHRSTPAIRRVVAGVEEGGSSERVARAAHQLCDVEGGSLTMVTCVDADRDLVKRPEQFGIPAEVWSEAITAHAADVFRPLRVVAPNADELVTFGNAVDELRRVATDLSADVIVVARKGRSGRDVDAWFSVAFSLAIKGPFATLIV